MSVKTLLVDGHVHIYPNFDLPLAIKAGEQNLLRAGRPGAEDQVIQVWLLTERSDCNFFDQAVISKPGKYKNLELLPSTEPESILVKREDRPVLFLISGRQVVTREGLEVNALATRLELKDREYPVTETIARIKESGGVAVLNWAPGKWFLARGKTVKKLITESAPQDFLIGDTFMRPKLWALPLLMRLARKRGFKIIAGSDPLPFAGEEKNIGKYGFKLAGAINPERPAESFRKLIFNPQTQVQVIGNRSGGLQFVRRQTKIMQEKQERV